MILSFMRILTPNVCVKQNASEEKAGRHLNLAVGQGTARAGGGGEEAEEKARTASAVALASARSELAGLLHEQWKLLEAEELYRCVSSLCLYVCVCGTRIGMYSTP